jgi:hypothetical protein
MGDAELFREVWITEQKAPGSEDPVTILDAARFL